MDKLKHIKVWQRKMLQGGGKRIPLWPGNAKLKQIGKHSICMVKLNDTGSYHPGLQQTILEREKLAADK